MNRLNRIMNNLFDLIIILVKIGVSYMIELWENLSWIWKEDIPHHLQEEVEMWNGGSTGRENKDEVIYADGITDTPIDDNVIYDGMMGDIQDDNG